MGASRYLADCTASSMVLSKNVAVNFVDYDGEKAAGADGTKTIIVEIGALER